MFKIVIQLGLVCFFTGKLRFISLICNIFQKQLAICTFLCLLYIIDLIKLSFGFVWLLHRNCCLVEPIGGKS